MSGQLAFDLPHRPALGAEDFLVSECNALAVRLIDVWPDWPSAICAITGPAGGGKSHLANVWLLRSRAHVVRPEALARFDTDLLSPTEAALVEDLDRTPYEEAALFHFFNAAKEKQASVLLTARAPPATWPVALPDLASRLRAIPVVAIGAPDDELLKAVLLKQFTDRQLAVDPPVVAYLARHMERSMETARRLVAALDRAALGARRKITRQLAAEVLAEL